MKLKLCLIMSLIAVAFTCMSAFGQSDLVNGKDGGSEIRLGVYSDSADGNQDNVREYDGRNFNVWGIELLDSYGYDGPFQYWLTARDLITGDEDVAFDLRNANELSLSLSTQALTHRFSRIPEINPYLAPLGYSVFKGPTAPFGDAFVDLTPDRNLGIDRRVNDFRVRLTPGSGKVALVGSWWQELEKGSLQAMFYDKGYRQSADFLIDRTTDEGTIGTDIKIGSSSAINYAIESNQYNEKAGYSVVPGTFLDNIKIPDVKTSSGILKARTKLGDKIYFTGVHINRSRKNEKTTRVEHPSVDISSTNAALTFLASSTLSLTGRYRTYKLDDNFEPLLNTSGLLTNYQHDRKENSLQLGASYTGVSKMLLSAGYEKRTTDRKLNSDYEPGYEEYPLAVNESTDSKIWNAGIRYNPTSKLSLSGKFENWDITDPGYKGTPTSKKITNISASYLAADNMGIYADYSKTDENNDIVHIPVSDIPVTAIDTTGEEERLEGAGQGYNNDLTTSVLGMWYAMTPKLTLDVNYGKNKIDASSLWVIGFEAAYPPHLPADNVPYKADYKQLSAGLTYAVAPKTSIYGRFMNTDSTGKSLFTVLAGNPDLPEGWTPVSVEENRWTIGFAFDVSEKDRLMLDYSLADWKDKIDSGQSGRYKLWRLAWASSF